MSSGEHNALKGSVKRLSMFLKSHKWRFQRIVDALTRLVPLVARSFETNGTCTTVDSTLPDSDSAHQDYRHGARIFSLGPPDKVETARIMLWVVLLLVFAGLVEHFTHHSELGHCPRSHRGAHGATGGGHCGGNRGRKVALVLQKAKEELAFAGFLSLGATLVAECSDVGHDALHDARLPFEWAHLFLFLSAGVNATVALVVLVSADRAFDKTHASRNNADVGDRSRRNYKSGNSAHWDGTDSTEQQPAEIAAIRKSFIALHGLPQDFNFALYLHRSLHACVTQLHSTSPESCLVVATLALANGLRSFVGAGGGGSGALGDAWGKVSSFFSFETRKAELSACACCGWLLFTFHCALLRQARLAIAYLVSDATRPVIAVSSTEVSRPPSIDHINRSVRARHGSKMCAKCAARQLRRVSTLINLFSLYSAALLMRYLGLALGENEKSSSPSLASATTSSAWWGGFLRLVALAPLALAWWTLQELVEKSSFAMAVLTLDRNKVDEVLNVANFAIDAQNQLAICAIPHEMVNEPNEPVCMTDENKAGSSARLISAIMPLARVEWKLKSH